MKIELESTSKIVLMDGQPCRLWEGKSETGVRVYAYIVRIAADTHANLWQFEAELRQCREPSVDLGAIPLRLII